MVSDTFHRQLLVGVLARHNEFITRDDFIAVTMKWLKDPSLNLGQVLIDSGILREGDVTVMRELADRHLKNNDDDPTKSLAALTSVCSFADDLQGLGDDRIEATLSIVNDCEPVPGVAATISVESTDAAGPPDGIGSRSDVGHRFQIQRPHAQGGLGKVSVAHDTELNREVALKEIHARFSDDPAARTRFLLEAEVTGGLEHPGIVPVYGLGRYGDGRPFYAMRFIRGENLKDAADRFHGAAASSSHPADDKEESSLEASATNGESRRDFSGRAFRQLLGRFVDVCQAVEYAHSRGVLHRDLKPGNIMLGKYGETLVVDWGLAKTLGSADPEAAKSLEEPQLQPQSGDANFETLMGSAIGTPAYMPPEQAAGQIDQIDKGSDVYSLGATLYYLLVGRKPFSGTDLEQVLENVKAGRFPQPRSIHPEIPKPLEVICLRAMATTRLERYESPLKIADELERFLADEPVQAYSEPVLVRARRRLRKHPRVVASVAATLLVGLVSLGVLTGVTSYFNGELSDANSLLETANTDLKTTNEELARKNHEAEAVSSYLVSAFRSPDPRLDGTKITMKEILDRTVEELEFDFAGEPRTKALLLDTLANTYLGLGLSEKAVNLFDRAYDLRLSELGSEDFNTLDSLAGKASALNRNGQNKEAMDIYEELVQQCKTLLGEEHRSSIKVMNGYAAAQTDAGNLQEALELHEQVVDLSNEHLGEDDEDTLRILNDFATTVAKSGDDTRSRDILQLLVDRVEQKHGARHPYTLMAQYNLGVNLAFLGMHNEAIQLLESTWETQVDVLGEDHPSTLSTQNAFGETLCLSGSYSRGIPILKDALSRHRSVLYDEHPATLEVMSNLSGNYSYLGDFENAFPLVEEVLEAREKTLPADHPSLITTRSNLAMIYERMGDLEKALPLLEEVLAASRRKQGNTHPETLISVVNLGLAYLKAGRADDAKPLIEEFMEGQRTRVTPGRLASLMEQTAAFFMRAEEYAEAESYYRQGLTLREDNAIDSWQTERVRSQLGEALTKLERYEDAEPVLKSAYENLRAKEAQIPDEEYEEPIDVLGDAMKRLVDLYEAWEKPDEAAQWQAELDEHLASDQQQ